MTYNKPYNKPDIQQTQNRPFDTGMISTQMYKIDNTNTNNIMSATINSGNVSEILQFFQSNIFSNFVDKDNNTPIHLIILITNLDQLQKISLMEELTKPPLNLNVDTLNNQNQTPLHIAIINQYDKIVKFLLDKKADPNKLNGFNQNAMHLALIPNIKPCEKEVKPNPIIKLNPDFEDKNKLYNDILGYISKNRENLFRDIDIELGTKKIKEYYKQIKYTLPKDNPVSKKDTDIPDIDFNNTPIEDKIQNAQQAIGNYLTDSTLKDSDVKKNIYGEIKKSLININDEYIKFITGAVNEIKINTIPANITDIKDIAKNILFAVENTSYESEEYIDKIEDNVGSIINNKLVEFDKKIRKYNRETAIIDILEKIEKGILTANPNNYSQQTIDKIKISNSNIRNDLYYIHTEAIQEDNNVSNSIINTISYIASIIVINAVPYGNNIDDKINQIFDSDEDDEIDDIGIADFLPKLKELCVKNHIIDSLKYSLFTNEILTDILFNNYTNHDYKYNIKTANNVDTAITYDEDTEYKIKLDLVNIYKQSLLIKQIYRLILKKMHSQTVNYLLSGYGYYKTVELVIDNIGNETQNYLNEQSATIRREFNKNLNDEEREDDEEDDEEEREDDEAERKKDEEYKKLYDNAFEIALIPNGRLYYYNLVIYYFSKIKLNDNLLKLLWDTLKNDSIYGLIKQNDTIINDINIFYRKNINYINLHKSIKHKNNIKIFRIYCIIYSNQFNKYIIKYYKYKNNNYRLCQNAFNDDLKEADEFLFLKKKFIYDFIKDISEDNALYKYLKDKIKDYKISNYEIVIILIKILDKLLINTMKTDIYYISIQTVQESIQNMQSTPLLDKIKESFKFILTQTNRNQSLDKKISDLIDISIIENIADRDDDDIIDIVDINMQKIKVDNNIVKYDNKEEYILYYPIDFYGQSAITSRQCMYNSTSIIKYLLEKSVNLFKTDTKGNTPLFYSIKSGNYLLLENIINKYLNKNYPVQSYTDKNNLSPIQLAFNMMESMQQNQPKYEDINNTFLRRLLTSADINNNIPKRYSTLYEKLLEELCSKLELNINNNSIIINDRSNTIIRSIIAKINDQIRLSKSINLLIDEINREKTELHLNISKYEKVVAIFEQRYDTLLKRDGIENKFLSILINMGVFAISDLLTVYYFKIIKKLLRTSNVFNNIEKELYIALAKVIKDYTEENIKRIVQTYYGILSDIYDRQIENQIPINNFLNSLIDQIAVSGIIELNSTIYNNIKQYVNIHMNELLSKTLDYNKIIIDVFHRWVINYYYSLKTFDIITKQKTN